MSNGAFHPDSVGNSTFFTIALTSGGLLNFKRRDVGFIVVAVMIFFSHFIKCLSFFDGDCDLFQCSVHMFLQVGMMTDARMDIEEVPYCAHFGCSEGVCFKVCMIVLQPFHHVMFVGCGLFDIGDRAVAENDASYDRFVVVFQVFGGLVNVKITTELFFVLGERVVRNMKCGIGCLNGNSGIMVKNRQKQVFGVACYVEICTRMTITFATSYCKNT